MTSWRVGALSVACLGLLALGPGCGRLMGGDKPAKDADGRKGKGKKAEPAAGGAAVATATGTDWTHVTIRDAKKRDAVCNNGEGATYFFKPGKGEHTDDWVMFLMGGGTCGSIEDCRARSKALTTPAGVKKVPDSDGILSSNAKDNPDFHDWNQVYLPYCSSDSWTGDKGAAPETGGLHFRGTRIIEAVVEDLRDDGVPDGPKIGRGKVLFTGASAGGLGMRMNVDRVAGLLPDAEWVKGVGDSLIMPERDATPEMEEGARQKFVVLQGMRPDDSCAAAVGGKVWECTETRNVRKYVETPIFTYMDLEDRELLGRMGIKPGGKDAKTFASQVRGQLVDMGPGVFSSAEGLHVVLNTHNFNALEVEYKGKKLTYAEVLGNWVFDRKGPKECLP